MPAAFEYAVVRVVPHVEREEFVNAGVIVFSDERDWLAAAIELDEARLFALAPEADLALIRRHLDAIPVICRGGAEAGPIGALATRERWRWLTSPRSTILQTSEAHAGLCDDPAQALEHLMTALVRPRRA